MQIIHQGGIDPDLAKSFRGILLNNILLAFKAISKENKQDLENTENYKKARSIQSVDENSVQWDDKLVQRLKDLWLDEGIRESWQEIKDSVLIPLDYLMANFDRYLDPHFLPNNEDILRARQRTTGGQVYSFKEDKNLWELVDVGGQYSERAKWESYFTENTPHAVIFFLALDEFNIANTEYKTEEFDTKFELARDIFTNYLCRPGPVLDHNICRIVFLNKMDLFQEKIRDDKKWSDFKALMDYKGARDVKQAIQFIEHQLMDINATQNKTKPKSRLIIHVTNALDTALMTKVSEAVKTAILEDSMQKFGILGDDQIKM